VAEGEECGNIVLYGLDNLKETTVAAPSGETKKRVNAWDMILSRRAPSYINYPL
jgi:hypothetical protein